MILNDFAIILLSLCFTIIPTIFKTIVNKKCLLSPTNFISLTSFLYLNGWIFYKNSIGENLNNDDYIIYIIPFLFLLFFHLGSIQNIKHIKLPKVKINKNTLFHAVYLIYFMALFLFIVIIVKYGFVFFILGKNFRTLTYLNSGIEKYAKDLLVSSTFLISFLYIKGDRKPNNYFYLILISSFIILTLLELRGSLAILVISILYFYHFYRKQFSNLFLYFSTISLFIVGILSKPTFYYLLRPNSNFTFERYFDRAGDFFQRFFYNSEFFTWFKILDDVKENFFLGNFTIKSILSFFTPGVLGGQSFSSSNWYVENYLPEIASKGGGRAFSFIVESYLDWTLIGMCLIAFIYGCFLSYCEKNSYHYICGLAASTFNFIWTGNMATLLKNYLFFYFILPIIIYLILSFLLPYKKNLN